MIEPEEFSRTAHRQVNVLRHKQEPKKASDRTLFSHIFFDLNGTTIGNSLLDQFDFFQPLLLSSSRACFSFSPSITK